VDERKRRWLLVGLIGLAFALCMIGLDAQSLWRDEVDAIRFASRPLAEILQLFAIPGQNGPLFYLVLRPWLAIAGLSEFALRFFSVVFGTLAVPLVHRLGRRLFPSLPSLALLAAFLTAISPYFVWYGQEGKMYALVVALVLFSMDRYLAALERGGWHRWLLYILGTSVAFYVHLIAALMVPAQAVIFFLLDRSVRKARWKLWLASMAVLTLPYLPLLRWQLPMLLASGDTGYRFVPLPDMLLSLLGNYSLGVLQRPTPWTLALFLGLLLAAGLLWKDHRSRLIGLGTLICWLLIPVLGFFLLTLIRPMYTARYLIFVLPAYLLLLAAGLVAIGRHSRLVAMLWLSVLLITSGWGMWLQIQTPLKADFRNATGYVVSHMAPGDLILFQIPYGRHSFDYYYRLEQRHEPTQPVQQPPGGDFLVFLPFVTAGGQGSYRWADGLYTNAGLSPGEVDRGMASITAGSPVLWLVATEVELWDERGLVQAWLDEHATLTDTTEFVRITVSRYQFP
jgi:mannosyltransferase